MASGDSLVLFTALHNSPPSTNPATFNVRNGTPVLEFDATTQEAAIFTAVMPRSYASNGLTIFVHWAAKTATTGTIGWDVAIERIGSSVQDIDSDGFATAQVITAATVPGTSGFVTPTSVAIANGADIDSLAISEAFRLRVRRNVSVDTAAGDAQLVAVEIRET